MEVSDTCPGTNPSDGEEGEQEEEYPPQKGYGKKHQLFGGSLTRQDEANDGEYDAREGESVYDSPGGHRHTHRHKKFRRHRQESSHGKKSRHNEDDAEEGGDVEDGEILEDGEIEDDEEEEVTRTPSAKKSPGGESNKSSPGSSREHRHSRHRREIHYEDDKDREGVEEGEEEGDRGRKDKRKKKRSKKERHERKDKDKKRRHRGRSYKDPDQPEDQDMISFDKRSRSPPPSYEGTNYDSPSDHHDKSSHHHHHHSPSKRRGSPGQYNFPYDSPPGLYDSPSYDEESDEGTPNVMRNVPNTGYDGEYMETEGQQGHNRKRKAGHSSRNRRRSEENPGPMPPRKKPLLEIPRHERPHCKFYMEGKCAKGNNCPFNHDFRPPRKPEICKFYLQSTCSKGEFCIYMHGDYPCKYFHTGAECYQGDNCKFSHEPLTDETRPLLEKLLNPDENDKPRPCLLGSPPRHLLEGGGDPTKKIPSLFDIEVFPPGQNTSPRKPAASSPSVRPSGFYKDPGNSPQAPMAGAPGNGPQHPVPPVLNMIGAILRQAPPEVVARVGQQGSAPPQGPPPGMQGGPRMPGPGMGPPPRGPFMGPGSSPDPRNNGGPGGPDMRGPGPNFHRGPMDQGPMMGPGGPMFQGIDPRGPPMDHFQRSQSMENRGMMPGMDPRGPPPGMDPRGMPPGMNQRGPNNMDPRSQHSGDPRPQNPMDPRGQQVRMDPRDPRAQGMEQRDSRDPRAVDQRGPQMDPRDPRNQNVSSGPADPRTNVNDPRTQKMDPRDPRNQSGDSSDPRNNSDPRPQRGLLPDPPGIEKIDPRQNYQEPRNVPFISKDPRAKTQNARDPRSANVERQDSRPSSAQSPPYEKESVSENSATNDPKLSPKQEPFSSPAAHQEEKMDGIKSEPTSDDASVKESPVKMEVKEEPGQDSQDTQELSQDGEKKEDETMTLEIASHLPPTQRNLFLRIRQQQHNQENPSDQGETTETSDAAKESQPEDDDWYSSDEEAGDTPKLMDVLKNLNKQPVPTPAAAKSTASTFNIMQMIQSIKNQSPADKPSPSGPPQSPSHSTDNPKQSPRRRISVDTVKSSAPPKEIVRDHTSSPITPDLSVAYPVIEAVLTSMMYRIKEFTVADKKPYTSLPQHVDPKDSSCQYDPRVQKYIARMGKVKPPMSSPVNGETNTAKPASVDPRRARHLSIEEKASAAPKPLDPRMRRDPRTQSEQATPPPPPPPTLASLEKAVTEQLVKALDPRANDPRLQRGLSAPTPAMHNLPIKPVKDPRQDPRLGPGGPAAGPRADPRSDPRSMSRQHSHDGRLNDPRSAPFPGNDPRMGFDPRMGGGPGPDVRPPFDNRMPFNPRMQFGPGPGGPRMGPGGPGGPMSRMPFGPRMGGPDNRMGFDPRMGPDQRMPNELMPGDPRSMNDPRSGGPNDPRDPRSMGPVDPRSAGPNDPRGGPSDPRGGSNDPRGGPNDPRGGSNDPRGGPNDPRGGPSDPRGGPSDPRGGPSDPRGGSNDPRGGPNDPRGGPSDPRGGPSDPRGGPSDPRGGPSDPRNVGPGDPRSGSNDPRSGGLNDPRSSGPGLLGDPRMGSGAVNDPRTAKSDPRSAAKSDPRLGGDDPRLQGLQRANSDPRSASAIPAALLEPPKGTSSDNASESESGMSDSQSGEQTGKKFDYRNDPRFKRKPAADASEKGILVKKFTGQRKSSMEYSSPLGMEDSKSENSGYNSYNRPNPIQNKLSRTKVSASNSPTRNTGSPSHPSSQPNPPSGQPVLPDIPPATGGLDPSIVSSLMNPPQVPLPNEPPLKDLFKSIDPTASPFC